MMDYVGRSKWREHWQRERADISDVADDMRAIRWLSTKLEHTVYWLKHHTEAGNHEHVAHLTANRGEILQDLHTRVSKAITVCAGEREAG